MTSVWQIWDEMLSEQDKEVIAQAGYDSRGATLWDSRSLGRRPALLVIDMQRQSVGRDVPILEAIKEYRTAMGHIAWQALGQIAPFIRAARQAGLPIIYTRVIPPAMAAADPALQIVEPLAPQPGDLVIDKAYASAFHGTDLMAYLQEQQVDTLVVTGNSTSGCVRSTVVDARQHGLSALVPVECVFDRIGASHRIALLDMWMKYATVVPAVEALDYVTTVAAQNMPIEDK